MDPINPIAGNPEALNQNPETPAATKDSHGITIIALAVFIVLSLAAVAFLYYQNQQLKSMVASYQNQPSPTPEATPDVTANWKTYTSPGLSFTFKYDNLLHKVEPYGEAALSKDSNMNYPADFVGTVGYSSPKVLSAVNIINILPPDMVPAGGDSALQIWVFDNKDSLNIDQWYEKYNYYPLSWSVSPKDFNEEDRPKEEIVIDGIKGKQIYFDGMGKIKYAYIVTGDKTYLFYGRSIEYDEKNNREILPNEVYQILSTFKFIDAKPTPVSLSVPSSPLP